MRVFVTGGTGFVGSHVVDSLLERGHDVACLVRDPAKAERLFRARRPALVRGGLDDAGVLREGCQGAQAVVHLAGLTAARRGRDFDTVNAGGTRALVEAAQAAAPEVFLYVSSLAAAGPTQRGRNLCERDAARPVSRYGASKLAGEDAVRGSSLPWTILRPPAVYGPRDRAFLTFFRMVARGWAPVFGDGSQELSLVYVGDLAAAIVHLVEGVEQTRAGGLYYVAHPETCTARGLVRSIGESIGAAARAGRVPRVLRIPRFVVRPLFTLTGGAAWLAGRATMLSRDKAEEILAEAWTCSPAALEADTGWRAETDLASGLRRTAAWYREAEWL